MVHLNLPLAVVALAVASSALPTHQGAQQDGNQGAVDPAFEATKSMPQMMEEKGSKPSSSGTPSPSPAPVKQSSTEKQSSPEKQSSSGSPLQALGSILGIIKSPGIP